MSQDGVERLGRLVSGRYRIDSVVGQGGVCIVYRGADLSRGREVAIKVLPPERARLDQFGQRFRREIAAAQRIGHPSVPTIYDSGSFDDGSLFLVMEFLEGRLLSQVIEEGALPVERALIIARQILVVLDAAHRHGIVHRDVKPKNVILVNMGGIETVKLFDFGIASNDRAAIKLTVPGSAFGTPGYISPEMAKGERVDARADLYSVGVTLFEMVTGRLPFRSDDEIKLLRAHIHEPAPSPRSLTPGLSSALEALILRALRKAPGERFASAQAMIDAVDSLLERRSGWPLKRVALAVALAIAALAAAWLLR